MGEEKIPCDCGGSEITSHHLLTECPLLNEQRKRLLERLPADRVLTPSLAIEPNFTPHFVRFIRDTGLGVKERLKYNMTPPNPTPESEEDEDHEEDFEFAQEEEQPFGAFE